MTSIVRVARAGAAAALVVGLAGWGFARNRLGDSDAAALARVEAELTDRLTSTATALRDIAARAAADRATLGDADTDPSARRRLFDVAARAIAGRDPGRTGATIYGPDAAPLAWAGRVSDLPRARIDGPATLFVEQSALGPRLVRVEPVVDRAGAAPRRGGRWTVVVEESLGSGPPSPDPGEGFVLSTSLVPVRVRASIGGARPPPGPYTFVVPAPDGAALVDAAVTPQDLTRARETWIRRTWSAVAAVLGVTLLLCALPTIERRRRIGRSAELSRSTLTIAVIVLVALGVMLFAARPFAGSPLLTAPLNLLIVALASTSAAWLLLDHVERRRVCRPRPPLRPPDGAGAVRLLVTSIAAGFVVTIWIAWYVGALRRLVAGSSLDVLHFSLHPLSGARLAVGFGLVLLHAAVLWAGATVFRAAALATRTIRSWPVRVSAATATLAGAAGATLLAYRVLQPAPPAPISVALVAAAAGAIVLGRLSARLNHTSQATRLIVSFVAFLAPSIAMYPSLYAAAIDAKERLTMQEFAPEAASQRDDLQRRLQQTVDQIDQMPRLAELVFGPASETPTTDRAFLVWSQTDLNKYRLTSAIEFYNTDGQLVTWFALILPEYPTTRFRAAGCGNWEQPVDEPSALGSGERHVLRTSKGVCDGRGFVGSIVVRVMLDYQTLSFISSQSPYLESLRANRQPVPEGFSGRDIEFAVYGWSRTPMFVSGTSVWKIPDAAFGRMVASREPFWSDVERDGRTYRVYFLTDRGGIYALGYPVITWFGHLINLAELVLLTGVLYVAILAVITLVSAAVLRSPSSGRALLREIRSSFYRKLFLMFVAGAVVPVVILALATRTYFGTQLLAGVDETAARTVTTAQRLVEDYAAIQRGGPGGLIAVDDQIMGLVRRAIDEDANLFDRARLQATSARDLFASQLLTRRTPSEVFTTIFLDHLPTYVGDEVVGDFRYRLAAAPVRAGGRDGIVTVPLANRQQEIDQQIDELDRMVLSAIVLFSLLGASLGYWLAERIADPVNRLTRATRRIARGDLDARIAATSSDELRRLVEDFNQMAADLKRQRVELERTQRLEAWADMARQVAHDIKNPLTPIQLSAEHAQRVNVDRGRPLSPVLDECVTAILTQVKLLRQIAAEFSSFASSPTPRPAHTDVASLLEEVVEPYRAGLAGRVTIALEADPALPPLMIDRTLFARALTNIIENALHAMPGGGRLAISARQSESLIPNPQPLRVVIEVADTGVGMDADDISRIFEPYFSTKATGTGLGLTIAKRNVELNGGTIAVASRRGAGTTVTIMFPAR